MIILIPFFRGIASFAPFSERRLVIPHLFYPVNRLIPVTSSFGLVLYCMVAMIFCERVGVCQIIRDH